jgi:tetratricopeptide (TPR) repeat protein
VSEASEPREVPEDYLSRALEADSAKGRAEHARAGLSLRDEGIEPDTHFLLLRQLYLAQIEEQDFGAAEETARQMTRIGPLSDIAHHDLARVLIARGREDEAIHHQRLAGRPAPATRRSFHLWSLATLQHFAGRVEDALSTLRRAERWAREDRPLIVAHAAYIELDAGGAPEGLEETLERLEGSTEREGYGVFLQGMIAAKMGDTAKAATYLRAFLRRNASADIAKALTLREELRRARSELARLSD